MRVSQDAAERDAIIAAAVELVREREERFVAAMSDVTNRLASDGDVDATLRTVTERSRELLHADLAVLALPEADGEHLLIRIADGYGADVYEGGRVPISASAVGIVILTREVLLLGAAADDERTFRPHGWPDDLGPALIVPLHTRGQTIASLTVANRRGGSPFDENDVPLMRAFAAHAAVAILDSRQRAVEHELKSLEARERAVAELHNVVIARISVASVALQGALRDGLPGATTTRIRDAIADLEVAVASVRRAALPR